MSEPLRNEDTALKHRVWLIILSGALLSSVAPAQTTSHFDVAGNVSFSGTQFATASGANGTQTNGIGWQGSGITHFTRWLSFASEYSGSQATSNSVSLIGYTGPGTVKHYSVLAGPRINLGRGRISPFVQGLAGYDQAKTSLTSGTTLVNGSETQIAYAMGGGAVISLTRRFGFNVEGNYFGSEHTMAFTGWEPSHLQVSGGIIIRLFGVRDDGRIAKERRLPPPAAPASTENASVYVPSAPAPQPSVPVTQEASVQPAPIAQPEMKTQLTPSTAATLSQPAVAVQPVLPTPTPKIDSSVTAAVIVTPAAPVQAPAPAPIRAAAPPPVQPPTTAPAATQPMAQPVMAQAVVTQPATTTAPAAQPQFAQAAAQDSQPLSLGEYARRLREKKQHSGSGSASNW